MWLTWPFKEIFISYEADKRVCYVRRCLVFAQRKHQVFFFHREKPSRRETRSMSNCRVPSKQSWWWREALSQLRVCKLQFPSNPAQMPPPPPSSPVFPLLLVPIWDTVTVSLHKLCSLSLCALFLWCVFDLLMKCWITKLKLQRE